MEFEANIVLLGCKEGYCDYGPATRILYWVSDVLGELYWAAKQTPVPTIRDRFPGGETPHF